jgi:hypothetical protein
MNAVTRPETKHAAVAVMLALACSDAGGSGEHGGDAAGDAVADASVAEDPLDAFFDLVIHDVRMTVDESGIAALLDRPREYTRASVAIDGAVVDAVGVRLKGGAGSFVPLDGDYPEISGDGNGRPGKSAFIIDFNRYRTGQDFLGLKKLTLNNMVQDPSCIHEFLGYALFREGAVPASRSGWARVRLNDEEKGLYALIETPDNDEFLERWFGVDDGNLYEGAGGSDIRRGSVETFDQDNGTDRSMRDLKDLANALDEIGRGDALRVLQEHFDIDRYLAFATTEIYLGHWDGYTLSANNFAIHHDPDGGRWTFLPWGIDQLFEDEMGRFGGVMTAPGPAWDHGGRVHSLCVSSAGCRKKLHRAFVDLFYRVELMNLPELARRARALVEQAALAESTAYGDPNETTGSLDRVGAYIEGRREALERWLPCLEGGTVDNDGDSHDGCTSDCDDFNPAIHPGVPEDCNFTDDDCNGIVDDPDHCPRCLREPGPDGVEHLFCIEHLTWTEALYRCRAEGGELASIHDAESWEHLTFFPVERAGIEEAWIGLNDREDEGLFRWSDGTPLDFDHWGPERPLRPGQAEDCVFNAPHGWHDVPCDERRAFICGLSP